jgi:carboxypeptidase C (cathepsin A)
MTLSTGRKWVLAFALGFAVWLSGPTGAKAQDLPAYDAKADMLAIGKDPERPDAEIFHVAYTLKDADPATRPVTFLFNGGPGAASIYLHLAAIGPKTIATAGDGSFPAVPARLETNPDSWIAFTDLVFIDPVGTGYSRMLPGPDGARRDPASYYGTENDLQAMARFMRQWLTVNNRWGSPKAIAGESYGGKRVAGLVRILAENYGINLNRAILISPDLNVDISQSSYSILYPMSLLPTQAAIAAYHGLNDLGADPAATKAVEDYTLNEYLPGLVSLGRSTPEKRAAFFAKVGAMIGLDPKLVERNNGRVTEVLYVGSLLADKGLVLDRYDGTQATDNPTPQEPGLGVLDRSIRILGGVLLPPFMDYVRGEFGYATDRAYVTLNQDFGGPWDYASPWGTPDDVGIALAQNTDLKVLVVHGYHDLVTNYFLSHYVLEQATRAKGARERLYFGTYPGGHMFYLRRNSRAEFAADVRSFFETPP